MRLSIAVESTGKNRHNEPMIEPHLFRRSAPSGGGTLTALFESRREQPVSKAPIRVARIPTPLGAMIAASRDSMLHLLEFDGRRGLEARCLRLERMLNTPMVLGGDALLRTLKEELEAYFAGSLRRFSIPAAIRGTSFQERVWKHLTTIPYGRTRSYRDVAEAVGVPDGQRAVGKANGDNRIAIVVPCHRVIRRNGGLSGYGGEAWRKKALLAREGWKGRPD